MEFLAGKIVLRCSVQQLQTVNFLPNQRLDILHVTFQKPAFWILVSVHILFFDPPQLWKLRKIDLCLLKLLSERVIWSELFYYIRVHSQNVILQSFHLNFVFTSVINHSWNWKRQYFSRLVSVSHDFTTGLDFIVKFDDFLSRVESLELLSKLYKLSFEGLDESIKSVFHPFFVSAKFFLFDALSLVDFINKFFIVHDFAWFRMVTLAFRTAKTVFDLTTSRDAELKDNTIMNTFWLVVHDYGSEVWILLINWL